MPGTRQCILSKCQRPRADMSTIKALGFGICCALGGREGVNLTDADAGRRCPTPRHIPPRFMSLQPSDVISRFCRTLLACKVPRDPPDWFLVVRDALTSLDFVTSSLPEHLEELLDCVTKVQAVLLEEDFKALSLRTPTEVEAFKSVHCLISHLNKAVAVSGASCRLSGVVKAKIAALEEYCRITLHRLSSGFHQPWHERLQNLLINLQHFQRPRLLYVMATLLTEAEQTLQKGCFTDAELGTLTHAQNMAYDYAPLHPYVAQISELQAKHETVKRSSGSMTSVEGGLPAATQPRPIRGRQQTDDSQPDLPLEDCQRSHTSAAVPRRSAFQSPQQQLATSKQKWEEEFHYSQYSLENPVQSPVKEPHESLSFRGLAQFPVDGTSEKSSHSLHPRPPLFRSPHQRSDSISHRREFQSHHSLKSFEHFAEGSHHSYGGSQQHVIEPSTQQPRQVANEGPFSPVVLRSDPGWAAPGQYTVPQDQRPKIKQCLPTFVATDVVERREADATFQDRPCVEQQRKFFTTESFSTLAASEVVRQVRKYKENAQGEYSPQSAAQSMTNGPTRPKTDLIMSGTSDGKIRRDAFYQPRSASRPLRDPEERLLNFENLLKQELERAAQQNTWQNPKHLDIDESLKALLDASLRIAQTPLYYNTSSLAPLNNLRSSLLKIKRKIMRTPYIHATNLQRRNLDQVIGFVSRAWHRLRLIDLNSLGGLFPGQPPLQLSEIQELTDLEWTVPSFVASQVYGALLEEADDEEAVNNFFEYLTATSNPLDSSTAKLCLLILLFLEHDQVALVPQRGEEAVDKLISKLRHELFDAKVTEVSLFDLPEVIELSSKCHDASEVPQRGWEASLIKENSWQREKLSPLVSKLTIYGKAFRLGLEQLSVLPTMGMYTDQVSLLERLYLCLQAPSASNFPEVETLIEQSLKFAEACIIECKETGHPASRHQLRVLEVSRNSLQWCRLLSAYLRVTPPDVLREAYDRISTAWILKSLWCREQTLFLTNSDRASITKKILSVLESDKVQNERLAWSKAFLDQSVPYKLVERSMLNCNQDQSRTLSDDDKVINLLTQECRLNAADPTDNSSSTWKAMQEAFQAALIQARLIVPKCPDLPVPDKLLNANMEKDFVFPSGTATQLLSLNAVLKNALKGLKLEGLTVGEVARHVAIYLLGESPDEQWVDFIVQDVHWCSYTARQLMCSELQSELPMLTETLDHTREAMSQSGNEVLKPEETPYLLRHFVNLATLRWLSDSTVAHTTNASQTQSSLKHTLDKYAAAWIPKWLVLMHNRQALFPSGITVQSEFFEALCNDVVRGCALPAEESTVVSTSDDLYGHLLHLLKGAIVGALARQDIENIAMEVYQGQAAPKACTNIFLAFLLCAWHNECFCDELSLIEECVKTIMHEVSFSGEGGVSITTAQCCVEALLSIWDAQPPTAPSSPAESLSQSEEKLLPFEEGFMG
eukprot:Blabericola_migrator_1__1299@NODE_1338_length_4766_cov_17_686316_g667_i1_p1_GENE_NODE_1338_length_4766_cov_17_686316_g667_i1NODE_1338_length_4766_cov_17_686316_g667_i1_p1_ORF_typecomplete_len1455_score244_45Integrase_Zn/PF02022_19/0_05_NODE_1338_length_4766_cov_17_686316_g667_i1904454